METSARADAFHRLGVRPRMAAEVARNTWLPDVPALPVLDVYTGPFNDGLDAHRLSRAAVERAQRGVVVVSALWGALRPRDRIPPYRVHLFAHLVGLDRLDVVWRAVLPAVLARAAGEGLVLDLRSPVSQQAGRPMGAGDRTVSLKVDQGQVGHRIGDVVAKRVRGEAAHFLLESGADRAGPDDLAALLAERWPTRLEPPETRGGPWLLTLSIEG